MFLGRKAGARPVFSGCRAGKQAAGLFFYVFLPARRLKK